MTSSDLQKKICYLILTLLGFQILVKKFLPPATIVSLAIFVFDFQGKLKSVKSIHLFWSNQPFSI